MSEVVFFFIDIFLVFKVFNLILNLFLRLLILGFRIGYCIYLVINKCFLNRFRGYEVFKLDLFFFVLKIKFNKLCFVVKVIDWYV